MQQKQQMQIKILKMLLAKADRATGAERAKLLSDAKAMQTQLVSSDGAGRKRPVAASGGEISDDGKAPEKKARTSPVRSGGPVLSGGPSGTGKEKGKGKGKGKGKSKGKGKGKGHWDGGKGKGKGRHQWWQQQPRHERGVLPIDAHADTIKAALDNYLTIIVSGDTGCGKSTQVPQIIMDHDPEAVVLVTQPRRLAAIALQRRVAEERGVSMKGDGEIGYKISRDDKTNDNTRCTFMTIGLLLQMLIHQREATLRVVTHIVIDEAHERKVDLDLSLSLLKDIVCNQFEGGLSRDTSKPLRLIIMSATFNADTFSTYFAHQLPTAGGGAPDAGAPRVLSPVLSVGSKCHPVAIFHYDELQEALGGQAPHLKESELPEAGTADAAAAFGAENVVEMDKSLYEATAWIVKSLHTLEGGMLPDLPELRDGGGAVLIFVPGVNELTELLNKLESSIDERYFLIIPVHGLLEDKVQDQLFHTAPYGKRKVVVATNIAESSITIDDVSYVIDFGLEKRPYFDPRNNTDALLLKHCSNASATQRSGRAGRVAPGACFRLYTKATAERAMPQFAPPEMLCCSLLSLVLKVKIIDKEHMGVGSLLMQCIQPPPIDSIGQAMEQLMWLGATQLNGDVTALGEVLSHLPIDLAVGRMLLFGKMLGCLDETITMAAVMSLEKDIFLQPFKGGSRGGVEAQLAADATFAAVDVSYFAPKLYRNLEDDLESDAITALRLYEAWQGVRLEQGETAAKYFAEQQYSSHRRLLQLEERRGDLERRLRRPEIGLLPQLPNRGGTGKGWGDWGEGRGAAEVLGAAAPPQLPQGMAVVLLKAVQTAAFSPRIAVGQLQPAGALARRQAKQARMDPMRTVAYRLSIVNPPPGKANITDFRPQIVAGLHACCCQPVMSFASSLVQTGSAAKKRPLNAGAKVWTPAKKTAKMVLDILVKEQEELAEKATVADAAEKDAAEDALAAKTLTLEYQQSVYEQEQVAAAVEAAANDWGKVAAEFAPAADKPEDDNYGGGGAHVLLPAPRVEFGFENQVRPCLLFSLCFFTRAAGRHRWSSQNSRLSPPRSWGSALPVSRNPSRCSLDLAARWWLARPRRPSRCYARAPTPRCWSSRGRTTGRRASAPKGTLSLCSGTPPAPCCRVLTARSAMATGHRRAGRAT
jgi:HrpA-like RNA helicase